MSDLRERIEAALEAHRELVASNCGYPAPSGLGAAALVLLPQCAKELDRMSKHHDMCDQANANKIAHLLSQAERDAEEIARLKAALSDCNGATDIRSRAADAAVARLNVARSVLGRVSTWNPAAGEDVRHWARDGADFVDAAAAFREQMQAKGLEFDSSAFLSELREDDEEHVEVTTTIDGRTFIPIPDTAHFPTEPPEEWRETEPCPAPSIQATEVCETPSAGSTTKETSFGFFEGALRDGQTVPIVPPGVNTGISAEEYVDLRGQWATLSEADKEKVRRFESVATGIGPVEKSISAEPKRKRARKAKKAADEADGGDAYQRGALEAAVQDRRPRGVGDGGGVGSERAGDVRGDMAGGDAGAHLADSGGAEQRTASEAGAANGEGKGSSEESLDYAAFIERKTQLADGDGFAPTYLPDVLFDFQGALCEWAIRRGRAAIYADTGLGKSLQELVFAENVVRHTNKPVLILTPLAVTAQTLREGEKFGIEVKRVAGSVSAPGIYITNYERLHHLNSEDFDGVILDESGCIKHFTGATQKAVTRFMLKTPYRLLATATPSPNDYIELGTSSEALGFLSYTDMLARFFKQVDSGKPARIEDVKNARGHRDDGVNYFQKLSFRVTQTIGGYRLKGHAEVPFWRWVASWARACRKPSDVGPFDDSRFVLPELIEREHIVEPTRPADGLLFTVPAFGLAEERDERRRTLQERCELVASLVDHDRPAVCWVHMNAEGDLLEKMIPGAVQVSGADDDDVKEERYLAFSSGQARVIITKPKCAAWGLNWQHCNHVVTFASHSWEQSYQTVRRCYRFGQTRPVTVDTISTTGEVHVRENLKRKAKQADKMFAALVAHMKDATRINTTAPATKAWEVP